MKTKMFKLWGYNWYTRQPWGNTHPDNLKTWYSEECVNIKDSVLELTIKHAPLQCSDYIWKPFAIGLVSCRKTFSYGTFTWIAAMPLGNNLWPALWMCGNTWPPEIDCVEGYTGKKRKDYKKCIFSFKQKLQPNVHYSIDDNSHLQTNPVNTSRFIIPHPEKFNKYEIVWHPDLIAIFYNNTCVYKVTDKKILKSLKNKKFYPIMNISINKNFKVSDISETTVLKVKEFRYSPYMI